MQLNSFCRYYFVVTKNSGEQFYLFTILAAWLIRKTGKHFDTPQEYDDPNSTIERILEEAKNLVGVTVPVTNNIFLMGDL